MYYSYPKSSAAYDMKNQYMYGTELMVAPITTPNNNITQMGSVDVWFPKGEWFDFFRGTRYTSKQGRTLSVHRNIKEFPVFAKAGAIVPLQDAKELKAGNDLTVYVFPGKSNSFKLYEDAGDGSEFAKGEFTQTEMTLDWSAASVFTVKPAQGALEVLPETRKYKFVLRGFDKCVDVKVIIDGQAVEAVVKYDAETFSKIVEVSAKTTSEIKLLINGEVLVTDNGDVVTRCIKILQKMKFATETKEKLITAILNPDMALPRKISEINFRGMHSIEHQDMIEALVEQLTLIEA